MRSTLLLLIAFLGACSSKDDLSLTAHGKTCIAGDLKRTKFRISDNGTSYTIDVYGDPSMNRIEPGCAMTIDKKTGKVVKILFSQ